MTPNNHDVTAAAGMLAILAACAPDRQLDTLAIVAKVVIEGHLPRFRALQAAPSAEAVEPCGVIDFRSDDERRHDEYGD